ncbi:MAG: energy-coupling factor transporter ATPase [Clostridia bacterium]|nr:energy-coupling factor transporter ATPase [Clostridia bacterium]
MSIEISHLGYTYNPKSPYEKRALDDVTLSIKEGDFVAIVGQTGSGKSTLVQHLNGLIKHTEGKMRVFDIDLDVRRPDYKRLRFAVGMVFQYPEYQLFADTVAKDVAFGPKNAGVEKEQIQARVEDALRAVGLDVAEISERSPFELSGGQKRRVALAGVIAMQPKVLVLDEPTAGLDPEGKKDVLALVRTLHQSVCPTVIMVSHDMEAVAEVCSRVVVMQEGKVLYDTTPAELFEKEEESLQRMGLAIPEAVAIANRLRERGWTLPAVLTPADLAAAIVATVKGGSL